MSKNKLARWRREYTGEPFQAALAWYLRNGLHRGLVPDAEDWHQQRLEAAVLATLARSTAPPAFPPLAGSISGLSGVTPDIGALTFWPAAGQLPGLLARLLPARSSQGVVGVAGLRAHVGRRSGRLTVGHRTGGSVIAIRATAREAYEALDEARALALQAGLEPLWDRDQQSGEEAAAWQHLVSTLPRADWLVWSRALRRIGLMLRYAGLPLAWASRAPTPEEVDGARPERLRPRPVGGQQQPLRGVVAVTSADGKGGLGVSTTAMVLSAELARADRRIALLAHANDPSHVFSRLGVSTPRAGHWADADLFSLPLRGRVRGGALPQTDVTHFLAEARDAFDMLVIDTGNARYPREDLLALADMTVALVPSDVKWADHRVIDHRPEWVQCLDWLDARYAEYAYDQELEASTPVERLVDFLHVRFAWYVMDRLTDNDPAVYDRSDSATEAWWGDDDSGTDLYGLPDEEDLEEAQDPDSAEVDVELWQEEFLAFLADEGLRRHPATWKQACTTWREHQRGTSVLQVIRSVARDSPERRNEFLNDIAEEALSRWGTMWEQQAPRWRAAREAGEDLVSPWSHQLETRTDLRPTEAVVRDLRRHLDARGLLDVVSGTELIVAVARASTAIGHQQLEAVKEMLLEGGVADVITIPDDRLLSPAVGGVEEQLRTGGATTAAAHRIARAVANVLEQP
ncbi:hypothetical protein [Nonomuraea jabiensis]|uniref:hypothetical protein n=1 Tax=Nonomuraea jabiensis TaxID=882448 RepID=UPI003D743B4D